MKPIILLAAVTLLLQACSNTKTVRVPTSLVPIESQYVVESQWQAGLSRMDSADGKALAITDQAGYVFVASAGGDLMALHQTNKTRAEEQVAWHIKLEPAINSGPVWFDGALYIGTAKGDVMALSAADGKIRWQTRLNSEIVSLPVMAEGRLYVRTNDGRVLALNPQNGETIWVVEQQMPNLFLRGAAPVLVQDGTLYIGRENGYVEALSAATGEKIWEARVAVPTGRTDLERMVDIQAGLKLHQGRLYVLGYHGRLAAINPANGNFIWLKDLSGFRDFAVDDRAIYVADEDDILRAFDLVTGTEIWSQTQFKYRVLGDLQWDNQSLLVYDEQGYIHWLNPTDGRVFGRVKHANDLGVGEVILRVNRSGDYLFVLDADGQITAYIKRNNPLIPMAHDIKATHAGNSQ